MLTRTPPDGNEALLAWCAAPVAHGPAVGPEISRLQESSQLTTRLSGAVERLRQLDERLEVGLPTSQLARIQNSACVSIATVHTFTEQGARHTQLREEQLEQAHQRAAASRTAFLTELAESLRKADESFATAVRTLERELAISRGQ